MARTIDMTPSNQAFCDMARIFREQVLSDTQAQDKTARMLNSIVEIAVYIGSTKDVEQIQYLKDIFASKTYKEE